MAYPIKNTATLQTLPSVFVGNYGAIGVNQGGYGLTSSTGFWNGKTPNVGGYISYVGNGTSSPTMYISTGDTQLIILANQLGAGGVGSITNALLFFITSPNKICVNFDYSNFVTSGLTLNLDAGFTASFPKGGGLNWYDLSGNANTGVLTNGPAFDSNNYGSIYFDVVDDYVNCGNSASLQTFSQITMNTWVKFSGLDYVGNTGKLMFFMSKGNPDTLAPNNGYWFSYDNRNNNSNFAYTCFGNSVGGFAGGGNNFSSKSYTFTNDVWYNITATVNSSSQGTLYINGVQQGSSVTFSNLNITTTVDNLIVGNSSLSGYFYGLKGNMILSQIYNRALSAAEVLQNYYAVLQRFIPTSTTTLWLDGENTNTRVITPTIAYDTGIDLSNGTLMNSMVLSHRDSGTSFLFDGANNYIDLTPYHLTTSTASLTVSIWFKGTSTIGGNTLIKFGSVSSGWLLGFSLGGIYFNLYTTSGTVSGGGISASLYVWHNVTFTYNGTAYVLYLNGSQVYTTSLSSGSIITGGNTVVNIGRDGSSNTNYLNGKISIVRTFAETLTATQVLNIYNAGKPRHGL